MVQPRNRALVSVEADGPELAQLLADRDRAAAALELLDAAVARQRAEDYLGQAYRDSLTGVLQRHTGLDRLADEVSRAQRSRIPLVIAFLDVDGLKAVNDTHGHTTGDLVLSAVGSALIAGLRAYDVVVRYGGDEFVCGLLGSSLEDATRRIEDVVDALAAAPSGTAVSCGLVQLRPDESLVEVIDRADRLMYEKRRARRRGAHAGGPRVVPRPRRDHEPQPGGEPPSSSS